MKSKLPKPKTPRPLNRAERARALAFHSRKMQEYLKTYTDTVFKAWILLNGQIGEQRNVLVHAAEFERIAKEASKCK